MLESHHNIIIELPIAQVMAVFKNQDYFKHWQKNLISFENTSQTVGLKGSTRNMILKVAGTRITMTEEITAIDLPHLWEATYRTTGVINKQYNKFRAIKNLETQAAHTLWEAKSTYKFTGMMRLVSKAKPDLFLGQTKQLMSDFKDFAQSL